MSLKAFHILFVAVSTMLMIFFAVWALREYARTHGAAALALAIIAMAGGLILLVYDKWFLRKIKNAKLA